MELFHQGQPDNWQTEDGMDLWKKNGLFRYNDASFNNNLGTIQ